MTPDDQSLITRNYVHSLVEDAAEAEEPLDVSPVEYVSRAAADELLFRADDYEVALHGVTEDVAEMLRVVADCDDLTTLESPEIRTS